MVAAPRSEFRGAWVTAWGEGFLSPAQADETVRLAKEANINVLFIQARKVGDAYYKSNYEPRASNIAGGPDFDPLAYIIEKAHASGIEVHAWVNTFRVWSGSNPPTDPSHLVVRHPEWLTRTSDGSLNAAEGYFLDPGVPDAADYTFNVFMDIVKNYNIDGIHFDYCRYPGPNFGYAPAAIERYNQETGHSGKPDNSDPQWKQWRRDQITNLIRRIYREATILKPKLKVTAATIPWGDCSDNFCDSSPFVQVYQDWRAWMEEGIIDANIPMNYKDESSAKNAAQFRNWIDGFKRWQYGRHVYCGVDINKDPQLVIQQLEACRKRGLDGMVGFSFNKTDAREKLVEALKSTIYITPAVVPEMTWKLSAAKQQSRIKYAQAIDAATRDKDVKKAVQLLKDALALDPDYADAHFRLGRCYMKLGKYQDAEKEFDTILSLDSDYPGVKEQRQAADKMISENNSNDIKAN